MSGKIKELLKSYDSKKVEVYISYLGHLEKETKSDGKLTNWWFKKVTEEQYADAFKKVADGGLSIDGDSVTLTYKKRLVIIYDYHAYKNKILLTYPESKFDFQLVYKGDNFTFRKESGQVIYTHNIGNPFDTKKELIGAYGVIKNSKGEFIEFLTMDDIEKMKKTSTMQSIWSTWFDRMVLKSIIKRICGVHFKDITTEIDKIDNETNQPERASLPQEILDKIDAAKDTKTLTKIYNDNVGVIEDKGAFISQLTLKRQELEKAPKDEKKGTTKKKTAKKEAK